ncbi:DoxX family protein [Rhizobium mesosinicum]|uniref:DoxX family protein n=1 Tax=Rhizobium mesosinicum TaxID=335017 RepID=A0ABS7GP88_9HYPH|nr:DoxX family protein [Rhizobium mesosinicum]MBW9051054.1 DoxX family protein [Rhizobium mesosinicum]
MQRSRLETRHHRYRRRVVTTEVARFLGLVALCSAYIQGPVVKLLDFESAILEMEHFGLEPAAFIAAGVIIFELNMSAMILTGVYRWLAALFLAVFTLIATFLAARFWELPVGPERTMTMNAFFEHLGLVGGFVLVAWEDLHRKLDKRLRALGEVTVRSTEITKAVPNA